MKKFLILPLVMLVAIGAIAQTYQQHGVVRMITTSASSTITPVAGVKVAVGNNISKVTGSNGQFTMQVTKKFQVNGVSPSDEYVLALPTKGKTYYQSQNDLDVVVTTKTKMEADYKKLYNQIKAKYDAQSDELMALKRKYQRKLNELNESDNEYAKTKSEFDSIQAIYLDYVNNEQKIEEEIKRISENLAITDYQTLDSIERRIYELKCQGEWKSISDLMYEVMHGDAAIYLNEKIANKRRAMAVRIAAEEQESAAMRDSVMAFRFIEETIESFKMQHLNDSVSRYYEIVTRADSTNLQYLVNAGNFAYEIADDITKAIKYYNRALDLQLYNSTPRTILGNVLYNLNVCILNLQPRDNTFNESEKDKLLINPRLFHIWELRRLQQANAISPDLAWAYLTEGLFELNETKKYSVLWDMFENSKKNESDRKNIADIVKEKMTIKGEKLSSALMNFKKAEDIYKNIDTNCLELADTYLYMSDCFTNNDSSLCYADKALAILKYHYNVDNIHIGRAYGRIGRNLCAAKQYVNSLIYLEKALKIEKEWLVPTHSELLRTYEGLIECHYRLGEIEEATALDKEYVELGLKRWKNHSSYISNLEIIDALNKGISRALEKQKLGK